MNRLSEEKKQEKEAFAKELNDYFNYDYGDPHNEGDSYYMSEMKLAKALKEIGVSVSQKSINRYRSGACLASNEVQNAIREVFEKLKHKYDRADERDPNDEDFMGMDLYDEDPYYDDGTVLDPDEYCLREDLDYYTERACTIGYLEDFDDEDGIMYPPQIDDPLESDTHLDLDKLDLYSKEAVKYITDHVELFLYLDNTDVKFVKAINLLSPSKREQLLDKLAGLPETLAYLKMDGYGKKRKDDIFSHMKSRILYQGAHVYGTELCHKLKLLKEQIQYGEELPGRIYEKVQITTKKPAKKCPEELKEKFKDEYRNVYTELRDRALSTDVSEWCKVPKINMRKDFFLFVNQLLTFTEKDWYHLYLFVRLQVMELSEQSYTEKTKLVQVFEDYYVQEKEAMLWRYLQMQDVL